MANEVKNESEKIMQATELRIKELQAQNLQLRQQLCEAREREKVDEATAALASENDALEAEIAQLLDKERCRDKACQHHAELVAEVGKNSKDYVDLLKVYYQEFFERMKHFWNLLIKLLTVGFVITAVPYITAIIEVSAEAVELIKEIRNIFPIIGLLYAICIYFPQNLSEAVRLMRAKDCINNLEKVLYPGFTKPPYAKLLVGNRIVKMRNAIIVVWTTTLMLCVFAIVILVIKP